MVNRKRTILAVVEASILAFVLLAGCSAETTQWIVSTFFDEPDTPPPPTRRVRRDLLREIEDLKRELAEAQRGLTEARTGAKPVEEKAASPVEQAKSFEEAGKLLPKDRAGNVDWVRALKAGTIVPRSSPDPTAPAQATLDLDVELSTSRGKPYRATFSHTPHTAWLACKSCHPSIFPLGRRAEPMVITMAKIQAGQYCGACHGKVAFAVDKGCARCHTGFPATAEWRPPEEPRKPIETAKSWDAAAKLLPVTAGFVDWAKALAESVIAPRPGIDPKAQDQPVLPITVERVPPGQPTFKAIFPHDVHTQWLTCANCHPAIFQMAKGATPINMGLIYAGQACGACHGKVAFAVTACGRCHPAMAGGK